MTQLKAPQAEELISSVPRSAGTLTIAVAGNPNAGKSTLINALAGTRLHVGNWPGVTVEKTTASFDHHGRKINLVDLPGTYSLSPYSEEEIVTRDYLVHERPDVIINVVDATNLERNLYLTIQLTELEIPMVVALNIYDEAEKKGYSIAAGTMEQVLGIRVIPTVATRKAGLHALADAAIAAARDPAGHTPKRLAYDRDIEEALAIINEGLEHTALARRYPLRWLCLKLMEGDGRVLEETAPCGLNLPPNKALTHLTTAHGPDMESMMADARYAQATGLAKEVLIKGPTSRVELTEKIDRIVLDRFFGIPIFLVAIWLVFKLTFDLSKPFADWMSSVVSGPLTSWAEALIVFAGARQWLAALLTDGIMAGVGSVIVFAPVIFTMMFFITFLEGSGYMARAAFVMDKAMHAIGLHGKSFIPMLLGFGCNVPAIYATRTLENPRDKALTALLIPLMSCGARLPVYVVFIAAFFPAHGGFVLWSLYVTGIVLAVLMGVVFKRTLFRHEAPMFIMELPPYRMPSFRSLTVHTWEKGKHFLVKAGTYILAVSVIMWFLLNLPWGVKQKGDSYLGKAGQALSHILKPTGFGTWEAASALLSGIIAKEIVVGTMGEIYAVKVTGDDKRNMAFLEDVKQIGNSFAMAARQALGNVFSTFGVAGISVERDEDRGGLIPALRHTFSPLAAYSFIIFVLLYMPCAVVAVAMRHEFGSWKWFGVAFAYQMLLAWVVSVVIYQGGTLLGLGG